MVDALINTAIACLGALALGLLAAILTATLHWTPLRRIAYAAASGANAVPVTALLPVFIAWFGISDFVVPAVAFPVWLLTTVAMLAALRTLSVDRRQAFALGQMGVTKYATQVALWEILPSLVAAVRVALPITIALVIALDYFLNVVEGLGSQIATDSMNYRTGAMWTSIAVVGGTSWAAVALVDRLQAWIHDRTGVR